MSLIPDITPQDGHNDQTPVIPASSIFTSVIPSIDKDRTGFSFPTMYRTATLCLLALKLGACSSGSPAYSSGVVQPYNTKPTAASTMPVQPTPEVIAVADNVYSYSDAIQGLDPANVQDVYIQPVSEQIATDLQYQNYVQSGLEYYKSQVDKNNPDQYMFFQDTHGTIQISLPPTESGLYKPEGMDGIIGIRPKSENVRLNHDGIEKYLEQLPGLVETYNNANKLKTDSPNRNIEMVILPLGVPDGIIPASKLVGYKDGLNKIALVSALPATQFFNNSDDVISQATHSFVDGDPNIDDIDRVQNNASIYIEIAQARYGQPTSVATQESRGNSIGLFVSMKANGYTYEEYQTIIEEINSQKLTISNAQIFCFDEETWLMFDVESLLVRVEHASR